MESGHVSGSSQIPEQRWEGRVWSLEFDTSYRTLPQAAEVGADIAAHTSDQSAGITSEQTLRQSVFKVDGIW